MGMYVLPQPTIQPVMGYAYSNNTMMTGISGAAVETRVYHRNQE
jgi:hypothetical protein